MLEKPLVFPSEEGLVDALAELDKDLAEELTFWQNAKLPPAQAIYQMGPQQFEHHCHSEAFMELFRILGITDEQLNFVYKNVVLNELRGLRRIAKQARRDALRQQIVDGVNVVKPNLDL